MEAVWQEACSTQSQDKGTPQFRAILKVNKTMGKTLCNATVCVGFKTATNKQMVIGC